MAYEFRETMRKKHVSYITIMGFVVISITIVLLALRERGDTPSTPSDFAGNKLERLFRDMGIVKVAHVTDPVEIALKDLNGNMVRLSDFRGKVVFLNFWATWCSPCRIEMPSMERLHKKLKDRGLVMLAINLEEPVSLVRAFFEEYKLSFTALLDTKGEVGVMFGISALPTTFIIYEDGRIIGAAMGARDWYSEKALALFEYLIDRGK